MVSDVTLSLLVQLLHQSVRVYRSTCMSTKNITIFYTKYFVLMLLFRWGILHVLYSSPEESKLPTAITGWIHSCCCCCCRPIFHHLWAFFSLSLFSGQIYEHNKFVLSSLASIVSFIHGDLFLLSFRNWTMRVRRQKINPGASAVVMRVAQRKKMK